MSEVFPIPFLAENHGLAVAVGIALDSYYAMRHGLLTADELERTLRAMSQCGLPIWSEHLQRRTPEGVLEVLGGLSDFREHLGGTLTITRTYWSPRPFPRK